MGRLKNLALHPLQSAAWGKFRKREGLEIVRLSEGFQMSFHKMPLLSFSVGYLPKCKLPDKKILKELVRIGKKKKCIFIKMEPNVIKEAGSCGIASEIEAEAELKDCKIVKSPYPLFTKYTFHIDLTKSEEELLRQMKGKTRYNIRLAQRHKVRVVEEKSDEAFEIYLRLAEETWRRQKFYSHNAHYHRLMWQTLKPAGMAHLLIAYYKEAASKSKATALVAWLLFLYKGVLYYPYGGSSRKHRNLMASNLMMWEAMRWGKKHGAKLFDLWGSLGPRPDKKNPWYGFHKFKEGYGGKLVEFLGSYDLILNPYLYKIYNLAYPFRQNLLKWLKF